MSSEIQKWYAHIDLDAFFASVEQLDHPEYKGKPVIVGGLPEDRRGVVSTASYEARKFGVHSAMPTYQAYKLCPQGIFVHGNYKRYAELSYQIMTIFKDYSPEVDQMSIDEAFIDLTGTEKLFGPPENTCRTIKERIKQETGLTVSIGLAPTKYVAKICSGYKKPDGFYKVEPGTEKDFMLNLPLEKVWGVGEKTLQNLHSKGIYTTKDIYEKDLTTLGFLFGSNTAGFLYDVVRGGKNEMFRKETKNHSISAEKTFPFDLTDQYTMETEILELAQGVMFRLLKEQGYSRTAFIKLRYEDFTTVSIQKTLDQNIKTLDSFYEQLVLLFNEKREKGRGIRLLGVGFDNVDNTERPEQQSLFDDNTQKKQQVEKAILKLNQKHPEIKVQKARTLKLSIAIIFGTLLFGTKTTPLYAQNITSNQGAGTILSDNFPYTEKTAEDLSIFDIDINDKSRFDYKISGFWNIDFSTALMSTFGNNTPFGFSSVTPVFKQEVEFNTWMLLNNQWYFDVSFADGFEKNTFTIGYKNGGYLNSAQFSNRNIGMSNTYSSSYFGYGLKGGQNQAPGVAVQFLDIKNSKWKGDLMVRYDMTQSKNAVFYGLNSVSDTTLEIQDYLNGKKFIIPQSAAGSLKNIKAIYVENTGGEYTDRNLKRYKKLSASQYAVYENLSEIDFTNDAGTGKQNGKLPAILVTFFDESNVSKIISATGDYSDSSSFAGKIQDLFNKKFINLSKYSYKLENTINSEKALVIQNSTGFSPYLCANIYDCGSIQNGDVSVISKSTELLSKNISAVQIDENDSLMDNFFYDSHYYAQLIVIDEADTSLQLPQNRYPMAQWNPQVYVNLKNDEDTVIRIRNYSPVNSLQIGTKAVEGTVYVYKNGIIDSGAVYNPNTGEVTLSSSVNNTDKIVIQYQEDSADFSGGALAAGLGFIYNFTPDFYWDVSVTTRWPLSINEKYSREDSKLNGFTALTNGIYYKNSAVEISDKLALSIQNPDNTGVMLANTNNLYINQTYYLSSSSGYITKVLPYLEAVSLEEINNGSVTNTAGIRDSYISGYAIPLYWDFTDLQTADNAWASTDIKLDYGNLLTNASCLEFALKPQFTEAVDSSNYDLYLQLGVTASTTFYGEDSSSVRTWKISETSSRTETALDLTSAVWQTVKINLNDYDRAFLNSNYDARFILVKKTHNGSNLKGRILIGPYEPYTQSIYTFADENISVKAFTDLTENSPSSANLNISKNYSTQVKWNTDSSISDLQNNSEIISVSNFKASSFADYKTVNFDFAIQANDYEAAAVSSSEGLTFILDRESSGIQTEGIVALKVQLTDVSALVSSGLIYHTLTVNLNTNTVLIDGIELEKSTYTLYVNKSVIPGRQKIILNTLQNNKFYKNGSLFINNLYYSDSAPYAAMQNNFFVKYEKQGTIASIKDYAAVKDGMISIDSNQNANTLSDVSITSAVSGEITLFDVKFQGDLNTKYSNQDNSFYAAQAGHNIQSAVPVLNTLSFNEAYRIDTDNKSLSKSDSAELNFQPVGLKLSGKTEASDNLNIRTQNVTLGQTYSHNFNNTVFTFNTGVLANQKINTKITKQDSFNSEDYFKGWYDISTLQFSTGENLAASRNLEYKVNTGLNFTSIKFSPVAEYNVKSAYTSSSENKYLLSQSFGLKAPFQINKHTVSINYSKKGTDSLLCTTQQNYSDDTSLLFQNNFNNSSFFKSIPFAELFGESTINNLMLNNSGKLYSTYSSRYELEWKRPLFNSIKDLYIPGSSTLALERDSKVSDSISDIYQIKLSVNNAAVNNFGSKAPQPVFTWFESDEFFSSLTGTVKIPSDQTSGIVYNLSCYTQLLLYINQNSSLKTAFDFQFDTGNYWNAKTTVIYTRPGKTSFLVDVTKYLFPSTEDIEFKISQKETGNFQIGKNSTQWFQQYDYQHATSLSFLKNYSLDLGIGTTFTWNQITAYSMAVNLSISGKMKF